jgi:uncharacterized protein
MRVRQRASRPHFAVVAAVAWLAPAAVLAAGNELIAAIQSGDAASARARIAEGLDPNTADATGTSALHWAVHRDDVELVRALAAAGANVTALNRYGVPPIFLAAENGNAAIVRLLIEHGADPDTATPDGETALMTAARTGDVATIRTLLDAGANPNAREGWKGQTALMWAAAENNAAAIEVLLGAGAERDALSAGGEFNALTFAVRHGAIDALGALAAAGADVDQTLLNGTSMLVLAATNAHYEIAGALLDLGADPNAAAQGWTALHQIAWSRRWNMGFNLPGPYRTGNLSSLDLVRRLIAYGADIDARQTAEPIDGNRNKMNRIGATAFLLAAKSCDVQLMQLLLELGADPAIATEDGTTALMAAAGVGIWAPGENPGTHEEALAAVRLAHQVGGGDINDINDQGDTALHGAVYRGGAIPVIQFLIERGARLDVVNDLGWTPVTAADGVEYTPAVLKRYPEAAELLRHHMALQGLPVPPSSQPGR